MEKKREPTEQSRQLGKGCGLDAGTVRIFLEVSGLCWSLVGERRGSRMHPEECSASEHQNRVGMALWFVSGFVVLNQTDLFSLVKSVSLLVVLSGMLSPPFIPASTWLFSSFVLFSWRRWNSFRGYSHQHCVLNGDKLAMIEEKLK